MNKIALAVLLTIIAAAFEKKQEPAPVSVPREEVVASTPLQVRADDTPTAVREEATVDSTATAISDEAALAVVSLSQPSVANPWDQAATGDTSTTFSQGRAAVCEDRNAQAGQTRNSGVGNGTDLCGKQIDPLGTQRLAYTHPAPAAPPAPAYVPAQAFQRATTYGRCFGGNCGSAAYSGGYRYQRPRLFGRR